MLKFHMNVMFLDSAPEFFPNFKISDLKLAKIRNVICKITSSIQLFHSGNSWAILDSISDTNL
jgi:hypothetical protein